MEVVTPPDFQADIHLCGPTQESIQHIPIISQPALPSASADTVHECEALWWAKFRSNSSINQHFMSSRLMVQTSLRISLERGNGGPVLALQLAPSSRQLGYRLKMWTPEGGGRNAKEATLLWKIINVCGVHFYFGLVNFIQTCNCCLPTVKPCFTWPTSLPSASSLGWCWEICDALLWG